MKKEGKDFKGGKRLSKRDSLLDFIDEDRAKMSKKYMKKIINENNKWDQVVETDVVEEPIEEVSGEETVKAMQKMKSGKD